MKSRIFSIGTGILFYFGFAAASEISTFPRENCPKVLLRLGVITAPVNALVVLNDFVWGVGGRGGYRRVCNADDCLVSKKNPLLIPFLYTRINANSDQIEMIEKHLFKYHQVGPYPTCVKATCGALGAAGINIDSEYARRFPLLLSSYLRRQRKLGNTMIGETNLVHGRFIFDAITPLAAAAEGMGILANWTWYSGKYFLTRDRKKIRPHFD